MHHEEFVESEFNTEDHSTVFNTNFQNSPIDLPSLRSSQKDHISLLQLALKIIPRLRSTHRFLLLWIVLHLGLGFLALGLSLFIKSLGECYALANSLLKFLKRFLGLATSSFSMPLVFLIFWYPRRCPPSVTSLIPPVPIPLGKLLAVQLS